MEMSDIIVPLTLTQAINHMLTLIIFNPLQVFMVIQEMSGKT